MEHLWILPIGLVVLLEIAAIIVVANEDILYSVEEKIKKILFIILVPVVGAVIELSKLDKYARYRKDNNGNDVMEYEFWDYYTSSQSVGRDSDSGGDSGGGGD